MINSTPLDCTICTKEICPNSKVNDSLPNMNHNAWWIKKFCTYNAVDKFLLYFPLFLLALSLILLLIERVFVKAFGAETEMKSIYGLLANEKLIEVKDEEKPKISSNNLAKEVFYSVGRNPNFFIAYLTRHFIQFGTALILLALLIIEGLELNQDEIHCNIGLKWYLCSGHPQQFYFYLLCFTFGLLGFYLVCSIFAILWVLIPQIGELSKVMNEIEHLESSYHKYKDVQLLLGLLAAHSGLLLFFSFKSHFRAKSDFFFLLFSFEV